MFRTCLGCPCTHRFPEVAHPREFGIPNAQDLELVTPDGITLRCYMLRQSQQLKSDPDASPLPDDTDSDISDDEASYVSASWPVPNLRNTVCGKTSYYCHVPRKCRKPWPSNSFSQSLLHAHALQCVDDVLQRVSYDAYGNSDFRPRYSQIWAFRWDSK